MNILYAALAVALGLGGAIGANTLLQGGKNPATALSAKSPVPSKTVGALGSYVEYQKALFPAVFPKSPGAGLPASEYRIAVRECVITLEVRSWSWRADAEAAMVEAYRKAVASTGGDANAAALPKSPFPGSPQKGERILTHSFEKFDLRSFDLEKVRRKDADGFVVGIASAAETSGEHDTTNRAIVDVMVSRAETPEKAEGLRKFGRFGKMKFSLPFGDRSDPRWRETKETFDVLRDAVMRDDRVTNVTMGVSSSVLEDGTTILMSGGLKQPRHFPVYASNAADLDGLIHTLRRYKNNDCR